MIALICIIAGLLLAVAVSFSVGYWTAIKHLFDKTPTPDPMCIGCIREVKGLKGLSVADIFYASKCLRGKCKNDDKPYVSKPLIEGMMKSNVKRIIK